MILGKTFVSDGVVPGDFFLAILPYRNVFSQMFTVNQFIMLIEEVLITIRVRHEYEPSSLWLALLMLVLPVSSSLESC